jgi:hypothetical protein
MSSVASPVRAKFWANYRQVFSLQVVNRAVPQASPDGGLAHCGGTVADKPLGTASLSRGLRGCRLLNVKAILVFLAFSCSALAAAQVKISVPVLRFKAHDQIDVRVTNAGTAPVTYCVQIGHVSYTDSGQSEPTPTPVYVQQKNSRGWSTLMIGPDIGSFLSPESLLPGESQQFPFRVNARGTMRLVLEYRLGSNESFCKDRKGLRVARSREFSIE